MKLRHSHAFRKLNSESLSKRYSEDQGATFFFINVTRCFVEIIFIDQMLFGLESWTQWFLLGATPFYVNIICVGRVTIGSSGQKRARFGCYTFALEKMTFLILIWHWNSNSFTKSRQFMPQSVSSSLGNLFTAWKLTIKQRNNGNFCK